MSPWLTLIIIIFVLHAILRVLDHFFHRVKIPTIIAPATFTHRPCYRHILINLVIGLSISYLLILLHNTPWLISLEDLSLDAVMQIRQRVIPAASEKNLPAFVLLDIDDATFQDWGEPLFTPRDRLKELLDVAVNADPRLIVVDIDLSQQMPIAGLEACLTTALHPHDLALQDYLHRYVKTCQEPANHKTCAPIIFVRTFRDLHGPVARIRPSFLEDTLTATTPYLQWGSTLFYRSPDQSVRRWWLWQPACDNHDQPQVIPSVELLAAALIVNGITPHTQNELTTALQAFKPENCTTAPVLPTATPVHIGELTVTPGSHGIPQRIVYGLDWQTEKLSPSIRYTRVDQQGNIILTVFSAKDFAKPDAHLTEFSEAAKDQVIVIGSSYRENRDTYVTPLGEMPGMLILTNAIHSLLQYQELDPLTTWQKLLLEGLLIAIMTCLFRRWESLQSLLSLALVLVFLLPLSIALFRYGYWLDFAVPLLTVYLHDLTTEFERLRKEAQHHPTA